MIKRLCQIIEMTLGCIAIPIMGIALMIFVVWLIITQLISPNIQKG